MAHEAWHYHNGEGESEAENFGQAAASSCWTDDPPPEDNGEGGGRDPRDNDEDPPSPPVLGEDISCTYEWIDEERQKITIGIPSADGQYAMSDYGIVWFEPDGTGWSYFTFEYVWPGYWEETCEA